MDAPIPNRVELRAVPPGREIVSFRLALDRTGRFVNMKALTRGGARECLLIAAPIALYLRDRFKETLRSRKGVEVLPTDDAFFERQPAHEAPDWTTESAHVGVPVGGPLEAGRDACILAFPMDREARGWTAYRLRALHAAYFLHAINDVEANEDFGRAQPAQAEPVPPATALH